MPIRSSVRFHASTDNPFARECHKHSAKGAIVVSRYQPMLVTVCNRFLTGEVRSACVGLLLVDE